MRHQCLFTAKRLSLTLAATATAYLAPAANAVEMTAGDWKFTATGNVNAHYIVSVCEEDVVLVDGGLACTAPLGQEDTSSSVSNGLLPAALAFTASTTQNGFDIAATFGFYPGISTNDGSPNLQQGADNLNTALGTTAIDMRQVFLTFGNERMGEFMLGRNIGLFQSDAILNDMTLLGVGAGGSNHAAPANTSLGSIGLGYIYADWFAQINYTTPDFNGFKFTLGIFDPLEPLGQPALPDSAPGVHAKASYTMGEMLYLSASFLWQGHDGPTPPTNFNSTAFDIGGKVKYAGFEFAGWYYNGQGVGTTGLFFDAVDAQGDERDSDGFLAQLTYEFGKTKLGVNYGESNLDATSGEINPTLVKKNSKFTVGVYYKLTENLTLLAEGTGIKSENQVNQENKAQTYNVGAFLSF
ncbi:MAG: porin [Steroidobacteraceae bacterium]|nr:porin [Steroidobacteraceae bacterium]